MRPIDFAFRYLLIPLNAVMIVWIVIMNHAYVHPTADPTSYPLHSKGAYFFAIVHLCMCVFTFLVGCANLFVVWGAYRKVPRRMKKFKNASTFSHCPSAPCYKVSATVILFFLSFYGLIASVAFRDLFANHAYIHTCDGYRLMAEIYVKPDDTPESQKFHASSTISFYKDGKFQYSMDMIRAWGQPLGFDNYDRVLRRQKDEDWGTFKLALRMPEKRNRTKWEGNGVGYFNVTKMIDDQLRGLANKTQLPPIGNIHYNLRNGTYGATFTNNSAPGFPPATTYGGFTTDSRYLSFRELGFEQSDRREWRFTDHVCLPPRVGLRGKYHVEDVVYGEMSRGCRLYRICALKKAENTAQNGTDWWRWIQDTWPVSVGIVTWEFEYYTQCCRREE